MTGRVGVNRTLSVIRAQTFWSNFIDKEREDGFLVELGLEYRLS